MGIGFRAAQKEDFAYCRGLYFAQLEVVTPDQESSFRERWIVTEVRMITHHGEDVGWLQIRMKSGALFLVQLFLEAAHQGKGVGTETMQRILSEAAEANVPMTLAVVKTNPAQRLYERLGFEITHEDDRKFYMRHELAGT